MTRTQKSILFIPAKVKNPIAGEIGIEKVIPKAGRYKVRYNNMPDMYAP